jgi:hypothetical protein
VVPDRGAAAAPRLGVGLSQNADRSCVVVDAAEPGVHEWIQILTEATNDVHLGPQLFKRCCTRGTERV